MKQIIGLILSVHLVTASDTSDLNLAIKDLQQELQEQRQYFTQELMN